MIFIRFMVESTEQQAISAICLVSSHIGKIKL